MTDWMEHWNWNQSGGMPSCGAEQTDRQVTTHNQTTRPGPGNPTLATLRTTITIHFLGQTKETPPNRYHGWLADARSFFFFPLSPPTSSFSLLCVPMYVFLQHSTAQTSRFPEASRSGSTPLTFRERITDKISPTSFVSLGFDPLLQFLL